MKKVLLTIGCSVFVLFINTSSASQDVTPYRFKVVATMPASILNIKNKAPNCEALYQGKVIDLFDPSKIKIDGGSSELKLTNRKDGLTKVGSAQVFVTTFRENIMQPIIGKTSTVRVTDGSISFPLNLNSQQGDRTAFLSTGYCRAILLEQTT